MVELVLKNVYLRLGHPLWKLLAILSLILLLFLTLSPKVIQTFSFAHIDKVYQFISFSGVTYLMYCAFFRLIDRWKLCAAMISLGLAIEVAQLWIPQRSFSWLDWVADSIGALMVALLFRRNFRQGS